MGYILDVLLGQIEQYKMRIVNSITTTKNRINREFNMFYDNLYSLVYQDRIREEHERKRRYRIEKIRQKYQKNKI